MFSGTILSNPYFWVFTLSVAWMLLPLIFFKLSWFYLYWTLLFIMGFYVKVITHELFSYPYIEPNGSFVGSMDNWSDYFCVASIAAFFIGLTAFIAFPLLAKKNHVKKIQTFSTKFSVIEWFIFWVLVLALLVFNYYFKLYVVGLKPKIIFPYYLGVPISFMIYFGIPLLLAIFVTKDLNYHKRIRSQVVFLVLFLMALLSLSMGSRAPIVIYALPILLGASYGQLKFHMYQISYKPYGYAAIFLLFSLSLVSMLRITYFYGESIADWDLIKFYFEENMRLFIDRWTGAESLMAAVSYPDSSIATFRELMLDTPFGGHAGVYQQISGSLEKYIRYRDLQDKVFATLPGYLALLALSGSYLIVALGVAVLTLFGVLYEYFVNKLLPYSFPIVSLVSATIAYYLTQVNFPFYFVIFIINTTLMIFIYKFINK